MGGTWKDLLLDSLLRYGEKKRQARSAGRILDSVGAATVDQDPNWLDRKIAADEIIQKQRETFWDDLAYSVGIVCDSLRETYGAQIRLQIYSDQSQLPHHRHSLAHGSRYRGDRTESSVPI